MKLKRTDFELLMQYLQKEKPETIEILNHSDGFQAATGFSFVDLENRQCVVKLFDAAHNVTPELTKTMKLYSRLPKASPSSGGNQGDGT